MEIFFFALGLIALAISIFFAFKKKHNASKCIAAITLGILFATFFMVLPTVWVKEGKTVENPVLYAILSALLYSFKALGGRQDIAQLETVALSGIIKTVYVCVNYLMFALAPILASSLVLSFVGDTGERIRYLFSRAKKCYVFSEINENSLALAKGISAKTGKKTIVFCDTKNADKDLIEKAKKLGAILLYKSCRDIKIRKRFKKYEFYLISVHEEENIQLAESLVTKYQEVQKAKVIINAFIEGGTNAKFLESLIKSPEDEEPNLELRCIDEIALFCNDLIYHHPLYNTKDNGKNISVAIIGCGRTGMRMLKTVYWAGQIDGYRLKIRVYDKNAEKIREAFYKQCPGLKNEESIKFVEVDVDSLEFNEKLLYQENSRDATYIVVAMGDDQLNLSVSDELYRLYRRNRSFDDSKRPEIFTRVRSEVKTNPYFGHAEFLEDRRIHLYGTTDSLFSDNTLFNTELENLSLAVHLAYWDCLDKKKGDEKYDKAYRIFKTREYDRRSSMAAALHLPAKLCMCDAIPQTGKNNLTAENIAIFENCLKKDKDLCERLAINEHKRWNAFFLSEGYQTATKEEMLTYAKAVDNQKDELSMLHPCIVDWDELDELEHLYNTTFNKEKTFKYYDKNIVKSIPEIWRRAQNTIGDE